MEREFRGIPWPISPSKNFRVDKSRGILGGNFSFLKFRKGLWNISIGNSNLNEVEFEIIK